MERISYEAHADNYQSKVMCYAIHTGGAVISIFQPNMDEDRHPRRYTFACDADFLNYADKIALLAEEVKRRS